MQNNYFVQCAAKTGAQPVETKGREKRCKMAKYAMIGKTEPIPQNSRSTVCDAFDCLQDDLVTSQAVLVERATCVAPEWPVARTFGHSPPGVTSFSSIRPGPSFRGRPFSSSRAVLGFADRFGPGFR